MRPPWTLSVVRNEVKAFESAAESMPMIGTFFAASSTGLPSALNSVGAMTTAAGFSATAFSRIEIWPLMSDFGLGAELRNLDAEVLASLARAGQHDLPIVRCGVLDDDRDGRLVSGVSRRAERGGHGDGRGDKHCLHEASSFDESTSALVSICISGRPEGASFG